MTKIHRKGLQSSYDALATKDPNVIYFCTDTGNVYFGNVQVKDGGAIRSLTVGNTTTGAAGTNASVNNSGTPQNPVLEFTIPRGADGQNAVNPFKGWYPSAASLPANPKVGDYAYVKGATASDPAAIYECTTAGTWSDSGRTADTSNVQTFASGEEVNETYIDDTHLDNPKDGSLPTANDVMQIKQMLRGINLEIFKPAKTNSGTGKLISGVNGEEYSPTSGFAAQWSEYAVDSYETIRFLGMLYRPDGTNKNFNAGYSFGHYEDNVWVADFNQKFKKNDNPSSITNEVIEYVIKIPNGVTHIRITSTWSATLTSDNFYCYLQSGENVGYYIKSAEDGKIVYENLQYGYNPTGNPISPTDEFSQLVIYGSSGNITSVSTTHAKIYCYPTSQEDRFVYVDLYVQGISTQVGGVWLIDNVSSIVNGGNISTSHCLNLPDNTNSTTPKYVKQNFLVPSGKILVVTYSTYNSNSYINVYETEYSSQVIEDIQNDITELQNDIADFSELEEDVEQIKEKTDQLEETVVYTDISSSIMTVDGNLAIGKTTNTISSSGQSYWKMSYFQARQAAWKLRVRVVCGNSLSYKIGQVFLVDNVSEIAEGYTTIPLVNGIYNSDSSPIDTIVDVPAGKIVVISTTTYHVPESQSFEYYEVTKTFEFLSDIEQLQEDVSEKVSIPQIEPDYVDSTNPLAIVKETPGYTSIFRKMGVIGGSMSTGWHSHNTGSVSANMPEYSCLQFMARLCGAEGHNFSRGGLSARSWPQNDMMEDFYDANKKCQMYLVQLGNNDLAYHSDHPEYTLGTIADLTPTGGTSISDYTYNTGTFYGNMARIINEIRKVQPRAYVFLSTFLKGYGTVPSDFDYNAAIRNIVNYYLDSSNRPTGDELHYYLIDIYEYGQPYSFYNSGIHAGTVKGSHLVATGYDYWAYEFCTYIDWIIKNHMSEFNDVAFVGTDDYN